MFYKSKKKEISDLKNAYKECQEVFKDYSKSYYLGSHFFNYKEFRQICALYAFLRIIDNIIDTNDWSLNLKKKKLRDFEYKFMDSYENIIKNKCSYEYLDNYYWHEYQTYIIAIFDTIRQLDIKKALLQKFFNSMKMDLFRTIYMTNIDLLNYMDGSAGIVGEIMYLIITQDNIKNRTIEINLRARDLGIAFQLTNFIRDIQEDRNFKPPRSYLPKREQDLFDINLLKSSYSVNSREFIIYQCNKNMNYYNSAEKGIEKLHNR